MVRERKARPRRIGSARPRRLSRPGVLAPAARLPAFGRTATGVLCVALLLGACRYDTPLEPGRTGPGQTVARVVIVSGPTLLAVGDSARFAAKAFDNADQELPVTFTWTTSDAGPSIIALNPSTGMATGVAPGIVFVFARAGSARSGPWRVEVVTAERRGGGSSSPLSAVTTPSPARPLGPGRPP